MKKSIYFTTFLVGFTQIIYAACTLDFSSGTTLNFGAYNPFSGTPLNQTLSFISNCSSTPLAADRTLTISVGSNVALPYRSMSGSLSLLNYNLYTTSGSTSIWGNGTTGTVTVVADEVDGESQVIYGQIAAQQNVPSGGTLYTDNVFVAIGGGTSQALTVQASVPNTCTFSNATLAFGAYDPIGVNLTMPLQASTTINVGCTSGAAGTITVGMQNGLHYNGTARQLFGTPSSDYLTYNLYLPSSSMPNASCSYSTVWGETTGGLLDLSAMPPNMSGSTYNICGQIDAGQSVGAGLYQDSVIMVLSY